MCGILGAIRIDGSALPFDARVAQNATKMIEHRGPDDEGTWWNKDRSVFLGHRRLSIIDLSPAGHQPMTDSDERYWIVFNGEIYNFAQLREELTEAGYVFKSRSDTEVILNGYAEWGERVLDRLRGMFAFAIYDRTNHEVFLARDRQGIKPLYYLSAGGTFVFASEIKPLFSLSDHEKALNTTAFSEYLAFGKTVGAESLFSGVKKFPAAHCAKLGRDGDVNPRRYWSPYETEDAQNGLHNEADWSRKLGELLQESVQLRMVSDVPVGVFLSGGVDSTANLAFMSQLSESPIKTFTAGFEGQDAYDERSFARDAADHYGAEYHEAQIRKSDLTDLLPRLAWYLDEPIADPTVVPIYFLSKMAREHGTIVVLNGDGADELFCGYRKYLKYLQLRPYWRVLNKLPRAARAVLSRAWSGSGFNGPLAGMLHRAASDVELYVGATGPLKGIRAYERWAEQSVKTDVYSSVRAASRRFSEQRASGDYAEWLSWWGLQSEVEPIFLYRADRIGMANSIEIRVPFLDEKIVSFAMQMPQQLKYKGEETKYLLKRALEPHVPNRFLYRRKQGFCVPIAAWGGSLMRSRIEETLPKLQSDWGLFNDELLTDLNARLRRDNSADSVLAWNLYTISTWYDRWFC